MNELTHRLIIDQQVAVGGANPSVAEFWKRAEEIGYALVKFTETRGGTELGFPVDQEASDFSAADFANGTGTVHIEGNLVLNGDTVRCIADLDLAALKGTGRLACGAATEDQGADVLRIHFTAEDLARVRMAAGLGVIAETVFALDTFARRGGTGLRQWHRHVRGELGGRLPAVEQLIAGNPAVPSLLWLLAPATSGAVTGGAVDGAKTGKVRAVVTSFSQVAVEPYWKQISSQLEREREFRARIAITRGFDGLLSTLHSAVSWKFPVLEIPSATTGDVYLRGRGVLLAPSLFLMCKHGAIISVERNSDIPAIIFPAAQTTDLVLPDNGGAVGGKYALGSLLGHSRAAALEVLVEGRTTGELSRQLGLSLAGASKHAAVLRRAGLVTTFRHRNTALHLVTPLGQALLRGVDAENSLHPITNDFS